MPLNPAVLGPLIKSNCLAKPNLGPRLTLDGQIPGGTTEFAEMCDAIAAAVVTHITSAALVTLTPGPGTIAVGAMGGGPGVPVTGTGTVT